ncbi:hypothetical protein CBR_g64845 [Chara braunii]|uniref:Integrase catalytic domain-containing protein n=1 Tax=Chara braunii TaxID=69332 RepID=A0A388K9G4_CHABU|nr:hypothetical protein CBR_g64845 [Chara braunii]|eukprot:GBG66573.1 hypothetical protein CBR_g64845 [Chara braunii]
MASQEQDDNQQNRGSQGTNRDEEQNEGSDQESAKPEETREEGKGLSTGESSGKVGGSKKGPQDNREGKDDEKGSPWNFGGTTPKKTKVSDACRKLAEIERRTAEYKARLIEQMMAGNEEDPQGEGSREGRRTSQGEARYGAKDNSHKGTPSKKGKEKGESLAIEAEKATTPPAIDSGVCRLPATSKATKGCDGLWSLRERVLSWFDPEGTSKTGEKHKEGREGEGNSAVGEAGSSEGGLKSIVATLTQALNKNQGYLIDAKKKLTFDRANIMEFLIDYENLTALLKWTEEEKMDHLGQHVSLSLGRDIMAIVSSSGSWKETRNKMMRKYLKAEKMATEAELAAVQRKNYATYNDFLRAFTLVALRIPRVTDRIMSKYFLRQFSEFDKDKILSSYQQTSKFEYTRDVDFSTVTDLAEKTVVTDTLALLKEGKVINLTGKTGDKVKKGIQSLHERVHGVDSKMDRTENGLPVMQVHVSRPALPPQEAVVPIVVANWGYGKRDPANEQCRYCTMVGHFVRTCPKLSHDIMRQRCNRSLMGEILGPQGERVNWNSPGGMRRVVIVLNNLDIATVEAEPVADIVWDQPRGRGPQANFILEGNGQDRAYLFGRWFILRNDPTNVAGALKNYKPIDPTGGRWIGFIWQFDYKVEQIVGLRNRADGLSRVCITPGGIEDAEAIDAFLEYEGGTLVVDNEMADTVSTTGQLLIQTLEKGAPAVVAELRKGPVTTIRCKDEKDSWGAAMGPKEQLMAMAVEGGQEAVINLVETWTQRERQYLVNQAQEEQNTDQREREFFLIQMYEGIFREIDMLLIGNKQPMEVHPGCKDNLSGYVEAVALKRKTGKGVADWIEDFYLRHPFVRRFIANNGTEFVKQEVLGRLKALCVPIKIIEPYHPEANAPVERGHRTLKNTIAKLAVDDLGNWSRYLKQAVFSENMTPKRTTGCVPAEL